MTGHEKARLIVDALRAAGIDLIAALPDAWMTTLLGLLSGEPGMTLIRVTREDEAIGICAGAWLGGRQAAVLTQNAGVLLSTNVLSALVRHHQIPVLILVVQRGGIDDDQFYQVYKAQVTGPVLTAIGVLHHAIQGPGEYRLIVDGQRQARLARAPVALLFSRAALLDDPLEALT